MSRQVKKVNISGKEDKSNKVTSWSNTTTDAHYPSEKLVKNSLDAKADKDSIYKYKLTSNDYNPFLNDTITITCMVTNLSETPVNNKTITLYQDSTSLGTKTTNNNGVATWTVNCLNGGLHNFSVENISIQVNVEDNDYINTNTIIKTLDLSKPFSTFTVNNIDTTYTTYDCTSVYGWEWEITITSALSNGQGFYIIPRYGSGQLEFLSDSTNINIIDSETNASLSSFIPPNSNCTIKVSSRVESVSITCIVNDEVIGSEILSTGTDDETGSDRYKASSFGTINDPTIDVTMKTSINGYNYKKCITSQQINDSSDGCQLVVDDKDIIKYDITFGEQDCWFSCFDGYVLIYDYTNDKITLSDWDLYSTIDISDGNSCEIICRYDGTESYGNYVKIGNNFIYDWNNSPIYVSCGEYDNDAFAPANEYFNFYDSIKITQYKPSIDDLGDDIMTMIDTALGHMITNWEDYE